MVIKRTLSATSRFAPLLRAGLIAGVVVAAVAYPIVAVGGIGAKKGAEAFNDMPRQLNVKPPAQTSYVYASDGKTLLTMFYEEHRKYVPISDMSPYIQQAIVASEDQRFYEHNGVDPKGIARAFVANHEGGGVQQGASTLTMQYVRMAQRDGAETPEEVQEATEQTSTRKLREMRLALAVEKQYTKQEILERYLNSAYFGHRAYGIYAASEVFFSKSPKDLTLVEAATLAGLVKAPTEYDPATQDKLAATARRNYVLDNMQKMGYLSPQDNAASKALPIQLKLSTPANDCVSVPKNLNSWGFFCDYLKTWWAEQPAFGDNASQREDNLRRGGYKIVTSLDPNIQNIAETNVMAKEKSTSKFAHGLVVIQPGTGLVKAMAVNRVYSLDQSKNGTHSDPAKAAKIKGNYPNTVVPLLGGGDMPGYQAGSTFKMFTMLAALDAGMPLSTAFDSPQRLVSQYLGEGPGSCGGRWCPSNASGAMTGRHMMWSGFGKSVNTYFVQLEQKVGADKAVRMAERLGLTWRTDVDQMMAKPPRSKTWGAFTLGVSDVTPLEMAGAYATVAADGQYCEPLPVTSIQTNDGKQVTWTNKQGQTVDVAKPRCRQEVTPDVARAAADAARCPTGGKAQTGSCQEWSTAPSVTPTVGRPVGGKTGTTDSTRSAWFVGFTKELAAASFIADPDNPFNAVGDAQSQKPIDSVAQTLRDSLKGQPVVEWTPPSPAIVR
ncbi:membrane peptidoglycan carboxypeptidase [Asanoa ferruginea]|uniref:Membrane peptidoglycan carboxypeptidase n=1 Tax=Asanoa ferruginea TaxID=53367 RepID=A0A3D9ZAH5_9ACTN|nr:membrane peptidoglycan carboxypeptidase [Asanoa ferruginea]GIF53459.1 carboxypeptidase [Asanoa ferruginea]